MPVPPYEQIEPHLRKLYDVISGGASEQQPQPTPDPVSPPVTEEPKEEDVPPTIPPDSGVPSLPDEPEQVVQGVARINNFNGAPDFSKGVWTGTPAAVRVSVPVGSNGEEAFSLGARVKLADNIERTVIQVEKLGTNLSITMTGNALDPDLVGYPHTLRTAGFANENQDNPVITTPAPTPPTPVPGVTQKGRICLNAGLAMGGDTAAGGLPGKHNQHYFWPTLGEFQLMKAMGVSCVRVGFLHERMCPGGVGKGTISPVYLAEAKQCFKDAKEAGMTLVMDMHNYTGYSTTNTSKNRIRIGQPGYPIEALGNDWKMIARAFMDDANGQDVIEGFDFMNEPIVSWAIWRQAAQHTINMIGEEAPDRDIHLEGINYSNTTNWVTNNPGIELMTHPVSKSKIVWHGHLYLDRGQDGFWTDGIETQDKVDANIGISRIASARDFAKKHGHRLVIGETMVPGIYPNYLIAFDRFLAHNVANGIDTYVFYFSKHAAKSWHDLYYKPENRPTLEIVKKYSMQQL